MYRIVVFSVPRQGRTLHGRDDVGVVSPPVAGRFLKGLCRSAA